MRRFVVAGIAVSALVGAHALARRHGPRRKVATVKASGPASLALESLDGRTGEAVAVVSGVSREPDARFFTFRTVDDRRFIPLDGHCVADGKTLRCTLTVPRPYLRFEVVGMELHARGRDLVADPATVKSLFDAARAQARSAGPVDGGVGDGGTPRLWVPARPDGGTVEDEPEDETDEDTAEWRMLRGGKKK